MQIVTIGSLYGTTDWKDIADLADLVSGDSVSPTYDMYVFMGNYGRSYPVATDLEIETNIEEIIALKTAYPSNFTLLIGPDDLQYTYPSYGKFRTTGNRINTEYLKVVYATLLSSLVPAYGYGVGLWTHGGVSTAWATANGIVSGDTAADIATAINNLATSATSTVYDIGPLSGGSATIGGPVFGEKTVVSSQLIPWVTNIIADNRISKSTSHTVSGGLIKQISQATEYMIDNFFEERNTAVSDVSAL